MNLLTIPLFEEYKRPTILINNNVKCMIDTGANTPVWTRGAKKLQEELGAATFNSKNLF